METLLLFKIAVSILAVLCAVSDARTLTIPNKYVIGIIALFPIGYILNQGAISLESHLMAAGIVFGISFILFSLKLMGGGDSKMITAIALWLGMSGIMPFMVIMALTGGILASISLVLKKNKKLIPKKAGQKSWFGQLRENKSVVPYGIAIAIGGIFGLF